MTAFEKWWTELCQKNPNLLDEETKLTLNVGQLRRNMWKAFIAGVAKGGEESVALLGPVMDELFDAVLGKGPKR